MKRIIFLFILIATVRQSGATTSCGFDTKEELMSTAWNFLEFFSKVHKFDPTFDYGPMTIEEKNERNDYIKKLSREIKQSNINKSHDEIEESILIIMDKFQKNHLLRPLTQEGFLQAEFKQEGCNSAVACVTGDAFAITFNKKLLQSLYAQLGPQKFNFILSIIIGHEIGHYIADFLIFMNNNQTKHFAAHDATVNPLKYHLLVDSIGMHLAGYSIRNFLNALSIYKNEGDFPDRFKCLQNLIDERQAP